MSNPEHPIAPIVTCPSELFISYQDEMIILRGIVGNHSKITLIMDGNTSTLGRLDYTTLSIRANVLTKFEKAEGGTKDE